jgi:hypothetical protein
VPDLPRNFTFRPKTSLPLQQLLAERAYSLHENMVRSPAINISWRRLSELPDVSMQFFDYPRF